MRAAGKAMPVLVKALPLLVKAAPLVILGLLIAFPLLAPEDLYRQTVLFQTFLLAIGAISWNVISGLTGYISLGQSAFLGSVRTRPRCSHCVWASPRFWLSP